MRIFIINNARTSFGKKHQNIYVYFTYLIIYSWITYLFQKLLSWSLLYYSRGSICFPLYSAKILWTTSIMGSTKWNWISIWSWWIPAKTNWLKKRQDLHKSLPHLYEFYCANSCTIRYTDYLKSPHLHNHQGFRKKPGGKYQVINRITQKNPDILF